MERREEEGSDEPKDVEVYEVQTVQRTADRRDLFLRDFCAVVRIIAGLRRNQIYVIQAAEFLPVARQINNYSIYPNLLPLCVQEFPHISKSLATKRYKRKS